LNAEAHGDQNNPPEAEQKENALTDTEIKVLTRAVVAEGEQSVAIDQAQATIINTGVVHGDIINVSTSQSLQDSTLTGDNIGAALNLVSSINLFRQNFPNGLLQSLKALASHSAKAKPTRAFKGFEHLSRRLTGKLWMIRSERWYCGLSQT
jgi:hypothetical protein